MFIVCVISSKLALTPGVRAASGRRSISAIARLTRRQPRDHAHLGLGREARRPRRLGDGLRPEQRGEAHQQQALLAHRQLAGSHRAVVLLGQPAHPLDDAAVDRAGVEEQDPPARRRLVLAAQAAIAGEVDVEIGAGARRRHQRQRRRPVLELARDPLDLVGGEVAGIEAHQQQRLQVDLLDADAGPAEPAGPEHQLLALPAAHPRELVELVELAPLRRYPVPVAEQPVPPVEALVVREPHQDPRQHRAPVLVLGAADTRP